MNRRTRGSRLVLAGIIVFYALPMLSMARFAFQRVPMYLLSWDTIFSRWTIAPLIDAVRKPEFLSAAGLSLGLAAATTILTVVLLLPTLAYVHVALPEARSVLDTIAALPFVVPAIALVVGITGAFRDIAPWFTRSDLSLAPFYVIIALPFTYRAIDNSLAAIDLRTIVDAARSLGADWGTILRQVIVPNVRSGLATAALLGATVVLGEFTVASLLLKNTLPLYLAQSQGLDPQGSFSVALGVMGLTTLLLGIVNRASVRRGITAVPGGL
jgi:putative spermidine/putrescine transport system permease protein